MVDTWLKHTRNSELVVILEEDIGAIIADQQTIERAFKTITVQFGPDTMLAAKVKMRPGLSIVEAVAGINALERELKARAPKLKWCFIEPDVAD